MGDQSSEHLVSRYCFALEVLHDLFFSFGRDDVDAHWFGLPEPPAPTYALIILFERVRRKERDVCTMLEVQSPCPDLRLGYQHAMLATSESNEFALLVVVIVPAADLYAVRNQPLQEVAFVVHMAPDERRFLCGVDQFRDLAAAFVNGSAPFLALFR